MVQGSKDKRHVVIEVDHSEFEYLMMGLHHLSENNSRMSKERSDLVDDIWAPQQVEIMRLMDEMVKIFGYDPAVEG
jgi:hypothetical protein